ncbi:hypothetical protein OIDMADRAFT_112690, partial [Oidiodendron maius Zn]
VHADSSNFASNITKEDAYEQVLSQAGGLFDGQRNWVFNWAGFYVLDPSKSNQLILGPFQGKVACQTIAFGRGVCGAAASTKETQLVPDVDLFPGHIACDSESKSEIVVPIQTPGGGDGKESKLVGIIDVDCSVVNGFDEADKQFLEQLAELIGKSCDW